VSPLLLTLTMVQAAAAPTPQSRLWDAAISGDTVALAAALKEGARVDSLDTRTARNGRRALNWAAINNRVDALRFLVAHGASIEATNRTGFTALHHAAEYGSLDAARVLLAAGADPKRANLEGITPAARAKEGGFTELAELLLAAEQGTRPKGP
jgi:ankyrin repeat protein